MTPALALTAAIAMALIVFRAATQAITIDEASTYILFVGADPPLQWVGSTNNHVLNTALMRLTTRLFGVSEFSARLPALLGAGLYISACYRFCRRLDGAVVRFAALVCLTFSPFIMDYLVAARGYSLALGLLMTALLADRATVSGCAWAATAIGLTFAANFSFAFVCAAAWGALVFLTWTEGKVTRGKLLAAYVLPPLLTTWLIALPSIVHFPSGELWYGAHSLREMFASLLESQLAHRGAWIYLAPGLVTAVWLIRIRKRLPPDTILFGGVLLATLALHFAAFHDLGLLYPLDRTGIFLVPLALCAITAAATVPDQWPRTLPVSALVFVAGLSVSSLKLNRFEEWEFNADTDRVYARLQCLHGRNNVTHIAAGWPFFGAMNFYRYTGTDPLPEVIDETKATADTEIFVLDATWNAPVLDARKLGVVWRSKMSEALLAVPSEHADKLRGSTCLE
jgi:4-amino-4-deoxy-L-arabinose transferase-like glycosyltransferase